MKATNGASQARSSTGFASERRAPTRGVDVGAKAEIYRLIAELAAEGIALLVISSEMPELLGLADRILVMAGGRVVAEMARDEASEERILSLAMADNLTAPAAAQ